MIKEAHVTFEQAKALKELGFPQKSSISPNVYADEAYIEHFYPENAIWFREVIVAPTLSLVQKWLIEKHNLRIELSTTMRFEDCYYSIVKKQEDGSAKTIYDSVYDDIAAPDSMILSFAISKCIEILKHKKYDVQ